MPEYIEREKLTEAFKIWQNTLIETYGKNDEYVRCLDSVLLGIDNSPAADVRPVVRGRWIEKEKDGVWWYACSACGEHIPNGRWGQKWHSTFCPNCGADMREEI